MAQMNQRPGQPGNTIDTPVGAAWPGAGAAPGGTDFPVAAAGTELGARSEVLNAQPAEFAEVNAAADVSPSYKETGREVVVSQKPRTRPSTTSVLGSAMVGAVAGAAIPFMLSGRKEGRTVAMRSGDEPHVSYAGEDRSTRGFGRRWRP